MAEAEGKRICKWLLVKQSIERDIISGRLPAGSQLPTIEQMVELYGIGKSTGMRVLDELSKDNLIYRQVGKGCFVKPFIRERLRKSHAEETKEELMQSIRRAVEAGFTADDISRITADVIGDE